MESIAIEIDIQPDDIFTINESGRILQYRGNQGRALFTKEWIQLTRGGSPLPDTLVRLIITAAHYSVKDVQPTPKTVPVPTHAGVSKSDGTIFVQGSEAGCKKWIGPDTDRYEVRPLESAPMSPNMRVFFQRFALYIERFVPDVGVANTPEHHLLAAARVLLREGDVK